MVSKGTGEGETLEGFSLSDKLSVALGNMCLKHGVENVNVGMIVDTAMPYITKDREKYAAEKVREAENKARYTLHIILSSDVDNELDHSDIEKAFNMWLVSPTPLDVNTNKDSPND